jgi:hypothetical protein
MTPQFDALPLFATDAELAPAIMGTARASVWTMAVAHLEGKKGFPPIDPVFGGRYRPAVRKWLDERWHMNGPGMPNIDVPINPELWNVKRTRRIG